MAKKSKGSIAGISPFSESKWQVEDDLRTLQRAIEIKRDPKRLKAAKELAKEKLTEMASVASEGED
jgi:hypothetical protein